MKIEILGTGCPKCNKLAEVSQKAAEELGITYEISKVKEINKIMDYGVMTTPALVIDGVVKIAGKLPTIEDVKKMMK